MVKIVLMTVGKSSAAAFPDPSISVTENIARADARAGWPFPRYLTNARWVSKMIK